MYHSENGYKITTGAARMAKRVRGPSTEDYRHLISEAVDRLTAYFELSGRQVRRETLERIASEARRMGDEIRF